MENGKVPAVSPIKVILTGATGMVGEGVLHECLLHPDVEEVLAVNRRPCGISHPKLKEIIHADWFNLAPIRDRLTGYDACFFCLGVSSVGKNEAEYARLTYDLTLHAAELLAGLNPQMVFCYVSGEGTDSTEQCRSMWARVKGRTENRLLRLPFKSAYMYRPGYIHPTNGLRNTHRYYYALTWLYPALRVLFPGHVITLKELGQAMIRSAVHGADSSILHSRDIAALTKRR
ncbi:NAD-dependent epimerase/dehydratase family protein [Paenibacillus apii]|uniref:NAD-dependent epimerase/dehydratase family protein n=1 Tax=Paenibacillus apii TaxID=1850370 RepID=UPI00143C71B5|nr:NAD-dependent epimerase/dehydratase family protein [Paenibacillus apii]NJJ41218.1 NAD-dependent epimerase/dehydratase family protein [Paenibacillus apii]